jgi:hypothetical protein
MIMMLKWGWKGRKDLWKRVRYFIIWWEKRRELGNVIELQFF